VEARIGIEGLDRMLRLAFSGDETCRSEPEPVVAECKWESTLGLVERTAKALRSAEERIRTLEARQQEVVRVMTEQLDAARTKVASADMRVQEAETRARAAEERARVDREWLARIHSGLEHLPACPERRHGAG
jgi:hypothetical protein